MTYKEILKQVAIKENVSVREVEKEMQIAIKAAGFDCNPKDFIENIATLVKRKDYI